MNELPCKFNPTGIICGGQTLCSFCGWNPQEAARRKQRIHALVNAGQRPHVVVRKHTERNYIEHPASNWDNPPEAQGIPDSMIEAARNGWVYL